MTTKSGNKNNLGMVKRGVGKSKIINELLFYFFINKLQLILKTIKNIVLQLQQEVQ